MSRSDVGAPIGHIGRFRSGSGPIRPYSEIKSERPPGEFADIHETIRDLEERAKDAATPAARIELQCRAEGLRASLNEEFAFRRAAEPRPRVVTVRRRR